MKILLRRQALIILTLAALMGSGGAAAHAAAQPSAATQNRNGASPQTIVSAVTGPMKNRYIRTDSSRTDVPGSTWTNVANIKVTVTGSNTDQILATYSAEAGIAGFDMKNGYPSDFMQV